MTVFAREVWGGTNDWGPMLPSGVPKRDGRVTFSERSCRCADTFESTASRSGVMKRSCRPRIMAFHRNSNFFQPAEYAKCFTRCLTVPCVNEAAAIDGQR